MCCFCVKVMGCDKPCPWIPHERLSFQGVRLVLGWFPVSRATCRRCRAGVKEALGSLLSSLLFSCPPFCTWGKRRWRGRGRTTPCLGGNWWGRGAVMGGSPGEEAVSVLLTCFPSVQHRAWRRPVTACWTLSGGVSGLCTSGVSSTSAEPLPFPPAVPSSNRTQPSVGPNPQSPHLGRALDLYIYKYIYVEAPLYLQSLYPVKTPLMHVKKTLE